MKIKENRVIPSDMVPGYLYECDHDEDNILYSKVDIFRDDQGGYCLTYSDGFYLPNLIAIRNLKHLDQSYYKTCKTVEILGKMREGR